MCSALGGNDEEQGQTAIEAAVFVGIGLIVRAVAG